MVRKLGVKTPENVPSFAGPDAVAAWGLARSLANARTKKLATTVALILARHERCGAKPTPEPGPQIGAWPVPF